MEHSKLLSDATIEDTVILWVKVLGPLFQFNKVTDCGWHLYHLGYSFHRYNDIKSKIKFERLKSTPFLFIRKWVIIC